MKASRTPFAAVPDWILAHEVIRANRTVLHVYVAMYLDCDFEDREGRADWESIAGRTGLSKPTIYRDIKAMRDAGIIDQLGDEDYWMPLDNPSTTVDSRSTTVEKTSTALEEAVLTESQNLSETREGDALYGFDHFWAVYPARNGRKVGKGLCQKRWRKMNLDDRRAAYRGALNYAVEVGDFAKDPDRWLRDRLWESYQGAPETQAEESGYDPDDPRWNIL